MSSLNQSMNPLANIFNTGPLSRQPKVYNPTGFLSNPLLKTQTLPNSGGTYNPAGKSTITPAPIFTGVTTPAPVKPEGPMYDKYRDPKTGEVMSPEEYAVYLGNKVPKGNGEISNYAGNAMTNPDQTANQLIGQATNLNNSRNDIATGTTDPYKVGNQSGIAYSPTELKAIENAYAGIYDPALNDVFSRLRDKQAEDAKKQAREDKIFATNESIRLWQATTGTKSSGGGGSTKDLFTQTQLNTAARNAGVSLKAIEDMDSDIVNFFVAPPKDIDSTTGKSYPMNVTFDNLIALAVSGELTPDEAAEEIKNTDIPESVQHYYTDQLPLTAVQKKHWYDAIWNPIKDKLGL